MKSGILKPGDLVTCTLATETISWLHPYPKDHLFLVVEVYHNGLHDEAAQLHAPDRPLPISPMNVRYLELVEAG